MSFVPTFRRLFQQRRGWRATGVACVPLATIVVLASLAPAAEPAKLPPAVERKVDFEKDVRPLFVAHCVKCHGAEKQESSLRLDRQEAAFRGGDVGKSIVPGKSAESLLIQAVAGSTDLVTRMPSKGDPLTAEQVGVLRAWIDQGAAWPDDTVAGADPRKHWAFQPPVRPAVPKLANDAGLRNDLDRFVAARLEREGAKFSPEADRATLLRRLSLDLIGLPPTIAEIDAFLADSGADAYARQVDRLLNSPHYGERWGRHWLDAARYADSDGFEKDKSRTMWFYRDWVVNALNRDLPYDQFIIEQLAGDQLPGATQDQIVATGFLRNSMVNEEGGIDPEQFRMEAMFDRMDAIGKGVLGLTIQCGQCHSHKYDPLTQEEYYRLFAYLNNDDEPQHVVYTPAELQLREQLTRQMREVESAAEREIADREQRQAAWEATVAAQPEWRVLEPSEYVEPGGGAKLSLFRDQSMLCAGYAPTHCSYRVVAPTPLTEITAIRLDALRHPNLPCGGPGRSFKGTFALTEIKIEAAPADDPGQKKEYKIAAASADFEQAETPLEPNFDDRSGKKRIVGPVALAIDGKNETAWGIDAGPGRRNQDRNAVFQLAEPIKFPKGAVLTITLSQNHGGWNSDDHQNNLLGRFRVSATGSAAPVRADPLPRAAREALAIPRERRSTEQAAAVFRAWLAAGPEAAAAREKIEALWKQWPAGATAMALSPRAEPHATHILKRGDFLKPGAAVQPGVPAFLNPLPAGAPPTRLSFARWIVDRRSPTAARVFVNRVWQTYFGTGLVATPEDFGLRCDPPSHPELLDWLACEFMDHGWSLKTLHRLIVTSATYRQSSIVTPEALAKDPYNRLLARGARLRVEGEIVRDISLAVSGLLDRRVGGPTVMPPAPAFLFLPPASYAPFPWVEATGPDRYRRALYTFRRRSTPYPVLANFDVPNADTACIRRIRSNTPLQALTTLNETLFMESAQALARRLLVEGGGTDDERITHGFRLCVGRAPTADERQELHGLLARQRQRIADGWINPWRLATGQDAAHDKLPAGATPTQWAAYTVVARVLLNLDETVTKE